MSEARTLADGKLRLDFPAGHVARLVIANPDKRNALDHAILDAIGAPRTRELFLLGRNVDATTALGWGLVNRVVPESQLEGAALGLATELAANAPLSLRGNKRVIRELLRAQGDVDPDVARELIALREACFRSEDMREGVRAFGEKRPPRWKGR